MCPLLFKSKIREKMLKKEKTSEAQSASINNADGGLGQTIKITTKTIETKTIFVLPNIFDSR